MIASGFRLCVDGVAFRKCLFEIVVFGLSIPTALTARTTPARFPQTFLASIVGIPLRNREALQSFEIDTWDVRFRAICHLPLGWRITAGGDATPDGTLAGEGGQGVTFLNNKNVAALHDLALITLDGPVRRRAVRSAGSTLPATFAGYGRLITYGSDQTRKVKLTSANIKLSKSKICRWKPGV